MSKIRALAGIIGDRERQVIDGIVDEIFSRPGEEVGLKLMPIRNVPAAILYHEVVSGMGGLMQERVLGEKGLPVNGDSSQTKYFAPGAYQEHVLFTERDLIRYRKFGTMGDRGLTGLNNNQLDEMSRMGMKLKLRMSNRLNKMAWDAMINGTYVWNGVTFSFAVPGGNALSAGTDWTVHSTSTPFTDLYLLQTTNAKLLKYKVKEWLVNPKTWADIMASAETAKVISNFNVKNLDPNSIAQFIYPGLAPIRKVEDHWQDESLNADGSINLADATFFMPNDKVLMVPDFSQTMYPQFGEVQITENINDPSSTIEKPAVGPYLFVDEKGLERHEAPYVKVIGGFNGGANLKRSNDIFVIST